MIPHVSTPEQARELVQAVKFPPLGDRGLDGAGRDANYWVGAPKDYTTRANRETLLVVQIETPQALENATAIAAVPGVDVLFIGPADMALRLGCTPSVNDAKMMEAQKKVAAAARQHGKAWGRPVGTAAEARVIIEVGAQLVAFGNDFAALHSHLSQCADQFDELLTEDSSAAVSVLADKAY
jgi:4-hydroxy-2-oxoheptanedioate aldolase